MLNSYQGVKDYGAEVKIQMKACHDEYSANIIGLVD
jgi:hypothetical protein